MFPPSFGDLSRSFQLRQDTARIKADLTRLTGELSSGVTSNVTERVNGNFGPLAGIERGLSRADSFQTVIGEQSLIVSAVQTTFTNMRAMGEDVRGALLTVPETRNPTLVRNAGLDALTRLEGALNGLNSQVGGISIFAGTSTDRPAVADAETILTAIEAEIVAAGAVTAVDVETVVDAWFSVGGGFDTIGYVGGDAATSGVQVSENETLPPKLTAEAEELRPFLSALALGGLLGRDLFLTDVDEQGALARIAGERLFDADARMVDLQARVGATEAQIERASVEVAAERDSLVTARSRLIEIDPFEAAIELQNTESQLQTIYAITARLSGLSLTRYL